MGEAVDTTPSILNKCLFVSPDGRKEKNNMSPDPCRGRHNNNIDTIKQYN